MIRLAEVIWKRICVKLVLLQVETIRARFLLMQGLRDNNHFKKMNHLLTICPVIFNRNCIEIQRGTFSPEMVQTSQLWAMTKCHLPLTRTPRLLMPTMCLIMLIKQGWVKPLITLEREVRKGKIGMSLQRDHVYP